MLRHRCQSQQATMLLKKRSGVFDAVRMKPPIVSVIALLISSSHRLDTLLYDREEIGPLPRLLLIHGAKINDVTAGTLRWACVEFITTEIVEDDVSVLRIQC